MNATEHRAEVAPFERRLVVAKLPAGERSRSVWVTIDWDGRRLSFTGVEGPFRTGAAVGSCGQITMGAEHHGERIQQYDRIAELWARWHLNDMQAGCEHQRRDGWGKEMLELVTYKLNREASSLRRRIEVRTKEELTESGRAEITEEERQLLALPYFTGEAPDADGPGAGRYEVHQRDQKAAAWVRPSEHPRGVLGKPCPECGYRYGTRWLTEEVPAAVLEELAALPDQSDRYPWHS